MGIILSGELSFTGTVLVSITGVDISAGHHGWSIRTLKGVVAEAGAHLEKLEAEITETGRCYSSDSARPKCSPDILSGQHSPCSDILKYFRTNDKSIISFKVYLSTYN